jgi:putative copper resistance protein D
LIFWVAASVAATVTSPGLQRVTRTIFIWIEFLFAGLLLGSLAWAGHGQEDSGWHLLADILHLLVAGFWPAGLLPLALFLREQRRNSGPERWVGMGRVVRRFSAISLGSVVLLVLTGWVNAWYLAGSVANLFGQPYGRWLLAKIILFCMVVAIGAVNLLRLKPRLAVGKSAGQELEPVAVQLQFNIHLELFLSVVIVMVVGLLGILPPAGQ